MLKIFEFHNKKSVIISAIFAFLLTLAIGVNLLNVSERYYWKTVGQSDVLLEDSQYQFTPFLSSTSDYIEQEIKPTQNGLKSIDIRMANEHPNEVDSILTFSLLDANGSVLWVEDVSSADMETWRYYTLEFPVKLKKDNIYVINIRCKEEKAGIPFKVFLRNGELKEDEALTFDGQEINGSLDLIYNYYVFPVGTFLLKLFLGICAIVASWIKNEYFRKKYVNSLVILPALSFWCLWLVEHLSFNELMTMPITAIIVNWALIAGVSLLVMVVTNRSMISGGITYGLVLLLAVVNHYILIFRGTVILPSDIYALRTAFNVASNYTLTIDVAMLDFFIMVPVMYLVLYKTNSRNGKANRIVSAGIMSVLISGVAVVSVSSTALRGLKLEIRQDSQTSQSHINGFLVNLTANIKYCFIQKPQGYSEERVQQIYANNKEISVEELSIRPNIIVIMNESLADLRTLGEMEVNEEFMGNFYRISDEENSKIGNCVVSVFGGGTSCSEFECLTGNTMLFLGSGLAPYQQFIHRKINALPSYINENNYETYAIHAASPKSWSRDKAYPLLGFDDFISIDNELFDNASYCRYWIDDQSMVDVIKKMYTENSSEEFLFGLTIQCHGGYEYKDFESTVNTIGLSKDYSDVNQYLTLVQGTDRAFGNLIEDLKESETPTLVLMFGDHLPSLNNELYEELTGESKENYMNSMEMYTTPYIFWANYDVDFTDIPDVISANFFAPYVLKAAGIELDDYYRYLYRLSQQYPVVSRSAVMNSAGELFKYEKGSECYDTIHEYEIIQYNRLNTH